MNVRHTFVLDLRRGARPLLGRGGTLPGLTLPSAGFDRLRGLRFPTHGDGGLAFWNLGKFTDAAGSIGLSFSLDAGDAGGPLLRTFGNYLTLVACRAGAMCDLHLRLYGHDLRLLVPCRDGRAIRVSVDWDARSGFRLSADGTSVARNVAWHPYRQRHIPIEIGGTINEIRPGRIRWIERFGGWIRSVTCAARPAANPAVSAAEARAIITLSPQRPPSPPSPPRHLVVVEFHDPPIVDSPCRFDSIPNRASNYRACQRAHPELVRLYRGAPNAFEGLLAVARFVANLWPHTSYWPWPRAIFEARGDRLLAGIKRGEVSGMCGGFAHVMEEALWALGVPARRTQVCSHSSLEAFDHEHDKWICLEVDNMLGHAGCWLDPYGVPWSIGELIALLERDRVEPGAFRALARHLPLGAHCPSGSHHGSQPESWARACYLFMGWFRRRDYGLAEPPSSWWYYPPTYRPRPLEPYTPPSKQHLVQDPSALYWSCNRLRVTLDWRGAPATIRLNLVPFQAQFFSGFELQVDGKGVPLRGKRFTWRLHKGLNRVQVAVRTSLGAVGHPWRMAVYRES